MSARNIAAAVILTCVCAAQGLAQAAATTDPWKRVPAAPTSCYVDDGYEAKLRQAREDIAADMEKQSELNATIQEKFAAMDGQERRRRMQAYMMKDPQAAMKMMQAQQTDAESMQSAIAEANADEQALRKELETLTGNFNSAADAAAKPFQAKREELIKTKATLDIAGVVSFAKQADVDSYLALFAQQNAAYEKMCEPFFGSNGTFTNWLSAYRTKVIQPRIDGGVVGDATIASQMAIMDTPTGGYRSTAPLKGVRDYMQEVIRVYALRKHKAGDPRFEKGTKK